MLEADAFHKPQEYVDHASYHWPEHIVSHASVLI